MAKEFSFADLNKEMSKISEYGETLDKSTISEIDHYIPTGNYHLNACLTGSLFGGYPNNRAVALAGPSGTGKTYLILNAIINKNNISSRIQKYYQNCETVIKLSKLSHTYYVERGGIGNSPVSPSV